MVRGIQGGEIHIFGTAPRVRAPGFSTAGGLARCLAGEMQNARKINRKILEGMYPCVKIVSWAGCNQPCQWQPRRKRCRHDDRRTERPSPVMPTRGCGSPPRRFDSIPTRLSSARPTQAEPRTCERSTGSSCDGSGSRPHNQHHTCATTVRPAGPGRHPAPDVIRPAVRPRAAPCGRVAPVETAEPAGAAHRSSPDTSGRTYFRRAPPKATTAP